MLINTLLPVFLTMSYLLTPCLAATTNQDCVESCSTYSVVLGFCRGIYGNLPEQQNLTFANAFVSCLCVGSEGSGATGNDTFLADIGTCEACDTTPGKVQSDLSTLLELCAVQTQNGTAGKAESFAPVGYSTSQNRLYNLGAAVPRVVLEVFTGGVVGMAGLGLVTLL